MKKYNLIINKTGFSEISFPLSSYSNKTNILRVIIKDLSSALLKIVQSEESKVFIIARYRYEDGSIRSLHAGKIISLNQTILDNYLKLLLDILDSKSNNYDFDKSDNSIINILFNFFIIPKGSEAKYSKWENLDSKTKDLVKLHVNEHNYFFPLDQDYSSWGTIISKNKDELLVSVSFKKTTGVIKVLSENREDNYKVSFFVGEETLIEFNDSKFNSNIFVRDFISGEKFYIDPAQEKIILAVRPIKTEFIKKLNPRKINKTVRIGTFDIETVVHNGEHKAYLYCFYDGKNKYSIFANTATELFEKLLVRKYSGFTFYAHNLSRFDIVFLFKDIAALKAKGYKIERAATFSLSYSR